MRLGLGIVGVGVEFEWTCVGRSENQNCLSQYGSTIMSVTMSLEIRLVERHTRGLQTTAESKSPVTILGSYTTKVLALGVYISGKQVYSLWFPNVGLSTLL